MAFFTDFVIIYKVIGIFIIKTVFLRFSLFKRGLVMTILISLAQDGLFTRRGKILKEK